MRKPTTRAASDLLPLAPWIMAESGVCAGGRYWVERVASTVSTPIPAVSGSWLMLAGGSDQQR